MQQSQRLERHGSNGALLSQPDEGNPMLGRNVLAGDPRGDGRVGNATVGRTQSASNDRSAAQVLDDLPNHHEETLRTMRSFVNARCVTQFAKLGVMNTPGERLRQARKQAGYSKGTEAANAFGWPVSTYLGHENGDRVPSRDAAKKYAKAFRIRWEWLLEGEGTPTRKNRVRVMGFIGAGSEIHPDFEQVPPDGLAEIEVPFPIPDTAIAFEVQGESMFPRYDEGDVVICSTNTPSAADVIGAEAAVRTKDGRRYLKRVLQAGKDRYDLESHNAPLIRGAQLEWVGQVLGVVRHGLWKKLDAARPKAALRR